MINMKKLFLIAILALTTVSCGLLDPKLWDEARERREERGERCYK
jgi:lipoprotein